MKSNSSSHHQDLIRVRLPDNLGLADSEDLVIGIDHRGGRSAHTEETDLAEKIDITDIIYLVCHVQDSHKDTTYDKWRPCTERIYYI